MEYYKAGALFLARRSQRLRRTLRRSFSTDYEERGVRELIQQDIIIAILLKCQIKEIMVYCVHSCL